MTVRNSPRIEVNFVSSDTMYVRMDKVLLDGVEYVKAAVIAKQFRYTADYIGQLCRGKKVDARLVGRTWFVNPLSLEGHQQARYQGDKKEEVPSASEVVAVPVIAKEIKQISKVRIHAQPTRTSIISPFAPAREVVTPQASKRLFVYYEQDEESLLPTLHKKREINPRTIRIEHVEAKRLAVSGKRREETMLVAGDLPDVALSGILQITDYQTEIEPDKIVKEVVQKDLSAEKTLKNRVISDGGDVKKVVENAPVKSIFSKKTPALPTKKATAPMPTSLPAEKEIKSKDRTPIMADGSSLVPAAKSTVTSFSPRSVQELPVRKIPTVVLVSPLIATLVACICVAFIMLANVTITVSDSVYESHVAIQMANLLELFKN